MSLLGTLQTYAEVIQDLPPEWRGPCGDLEGLGAREAGRHGVPGDGGEIVDECAQAVYRITVRGSLRCCLGPGAHRHFRRRHDGRAPGLGAWRILVVEQHGLQFLAHVPLHVISKHAQEDVGADPGFGAVVDGTDLQIHGLEATEGPFHRAEPLVGAHRAGAIELACRQTGADHIEAVEPGLGRDGRFIALAGEDTVIVDGPRDVFRHLVFADDLADPFTDLVSTLETALLAPCCCGYCFEHSLGGLEHLLSLAGAVLGQQRIAAHHETHRGRRRW